MRITPTAYLKHDTLVTNARIEDEYETSKSGDGFFPAECRRVFAHASRRVCFRVNAFIVMKKQRAKRS